MKLLQLIVLIFMCLVFNSTRIIAQQTIQGALTGAVTSGSAEFILRANPNTAISLEVSESADFNIPRPALPANTLPPDTGGFRRFTISSLKPGTKYFYRAVLNNVKDTVIRSFSTFPSEGQASVFSFLTGSCEKLNGAGSIFPLMARENAAFFLQQGDWGYPDTTTAGSPFSSDYKRVEESYRMKYSTSYPMSLLLNKMPVDYTYDDHDMASNNSDGSASYAQAVANSIKGYLDFFPHYSLPDDSKGLWHKFTYGNADFFMLDNRSQRDPNANAIKTSADQFYFAPDTVHSILGSEQMTWLLNALSNSKATWKFISSGTPFNPALRAAIEFGVELQKDKRFTVFFTPYGNFGLHDIVNELADKWAGFPSDIYKLLKLIVDKKITNVIFLSGDTHTSGLDDGKNSVLPELMAGPLDIKNNGFVMLLQIFGISVFNKGGHTLERGFSSLSNAYGRVTIFEADSVRLEAVSDRGIVLGSNTVHSGFLPNPVSATAVPNQLSFDTVGVFADKIRPLIITNNSIDTLVVSAINVSDSHYSIMTSFPLKVAPVSKAVVRVRYKPSKPGESNTALLQISSNSSYALQFVSLSGIAGTSTFAIPGDTETYELYQNYPNPFNPSTNITYYMPVASEVILKVYDLFGREVKILDQGFRQPGFITVNWDGTDKSGRKASSGIYLITMQSGNFHASKKITLLK